MPSTHHTLNDIVLPRGMLWIDELSWIAAERAIETSITGAVLMDVAVRTAGRPITLQGQPDQGHITRARVQALQTLANTVPLEPLTLVLADGREFAVQFAAGVGPIEAQPAFGRPELPSADFPYVATVRLVTV